MFDECQCKFPSALTQFYRTIQIGYLLIPPLSMPCMEEYPANRKCKYPGADIEMLSNILGPFGLQSRFSIFEDYKNEKEALENKTIDAFSIPLYALDASFNVSLFAWIADRPMLAIRKPAPREDGIFLIINTFDYKIWICMTVIGIFLFLFQRWIRKILKNDSNELPAVTAWWFAFGIIL